VGGILNWRTARVVIEGCNRIAAISGRTPKAFRFHSQQSCHKQFFVSHR